jgi:hypothetical protein
MIRRRYLAVLAVAAVAGCQQVLGISPGTLISSGGSGGASGSSTAGGLGGGGLVSSSSTAGGGASATGTSTSSSSSTGGTSTGTSTTASSSSSSTSAGATTGTSSSSSSSSSSSGTVSCTTTPAIVDYIDDMMSGQGHILTRNGRVGPWFTANNDQTMDMQTPVPTMVCDPVASSFTCFTWAMNTSGTVVGTNGYAQIGFDLDQTGGVTKPYNAANDAGAYTGIVFWAKAAAPLSLHVQFPIPATVSNSPASGGGTCTGVSPIVCGDSFEVIEPLTTSWAPYTVAFSDLAPEGFGNMQGLTFTSNAILTIQFQVKSDQTTTFNYSIGPVGFY